MMQELPSGNTDIYIYRYEYRDFFSDAGTDVAKTAGQVQVEQTGYVTLAGPHWEDGLDAG